MSTDQYGERAVRWRAMSAAAMTSAAMTSAAMTSAALAADGGVQAPFTEEAQQRGIYYVPNQSIPFGDGLAFLDLDNDGDPDAVTVGAANGAIGIFENDGTGHFTDRAAASALTAVSLGSSVTAADYDRDGDLDIYLSRRGVANVLLRNDGGFLFTIVGAGIADTGDGHGCGWADFDLDGWIDLYVANRGQPNRLYRNLGPNAAGIVRFTDVAVDLGVDRGNDPTFQGAFFDYDRDGDADLYLATDHGLNCSTFWNHLYENVDGTFVEVTDEGTEACLDAMCIATGDFDNNGWPDVYSTNTPSGNALMMNEDAGRFVRWEEEAGVASYAVGWGSIFLDYDNDGFLDLYVCNSSAPNRLYRHAGNFPCVDVGSALGVDVGLHCYSAATADIDGDGDLDLMVMSRNHPIRLLVNHEGEKRHWAKFDVVGEGASRYAVGAVVDVRVGKQRRMREIIAGSAYKTQDQLVLHFGLDDALVMDEIVVMWPGGVTRSLGPMPTNRTWTLYPPGKLGDGDRDGDRDLDDFHRFVDCFAAGAVEPGCEVMDYTGDGVVALDDFDAFVSGYDGPLRDCNKNGTLDLREILDGSAADVDGDGVLDPCEAALGDLNDDLRIDGADLSVLLEAWGQTGGAADLDGSGDVGLMDLLILLLNWDV